MFEYNEKAIGTKLVAIAEKNNAERQYANQHVDMMTVCL